MILVDDGLAAALDALMSCRLWVLGGVGLVLMES